MKLKRIQAVAFLIALLSLVACSKSGSGGGSTSYPFPLGAAVSGVTLSGPFAGKTLYLLPSSINPYHCWSDSAKWTGSELFYGISSINWTTLAENSTFAIDPNCSPQPPLSSPSTGNFNIYRGVVTNGAWVLSSLPLNSGQTVGLGAPSLGGSTLAFVKYEKPTYDYGNLYFAARTGDNSYGAPSLFTYNGPDTCKDDNPYYYSTGTRMIFESNRTTGNVISTSPAADCTVGANQVFWETQFSGGTWSQPTQLVGAPQLATQTVSQPWVDESTGNLYWAGTGSDCMDGNGSYTGCIFMASPSGANWSNTAIKVITPTPIAGPWNSGDLAIIGQFSMANGYAFAACGIVQTGNAPYFITNPNLVVYISICVIPL